MTTRNKALANFLDSIIEKYTATPRHDPEAVAYGLRPSKKDLRKADMDEEPTYGEGDRLDRRLIHQV